MAIHLYAATAAFFLVLLGIRVAHISWHNSFFEEVGTNSFHMVGGHILQVEEGLQANLLPLEDVLVSHPLSLLLSTLATTTRPPTGLDQPRAGGVFN